MPRSARIKEPNCTYHIIVRGNNRELIFEDDYDRARYLNTIKKFKIKYDFNLYAYTLMDNHIHLIVNSNGEDISKIMQSLNISYTYYFNKKYNRIGHLFHDRFKSIIVDDDAYLVNLTKYIHYNPVRAGISKEADSYLWSSCRIYAACVSDGFDIVDTELVLQYFSNDILKAKSLYSQYIKNNSTSNCPENKDNIVININSAKGKSCNKNVKDKDIDLILKSISVLYKLPVEHILLKSNKFHSYIRHECLYIIRLKSRKSIKNIGDIFGGICPAAVSYAISKTIDRMMADENTYNRILSILEAIA